MVLDLDLNNPPPFEGIFLMGKPISFSPNMVQAGEQGLSHVQTRTDFEPVDDEVIICSPRSFAEARVKSRRNSNVIEVLGEETGFQRGCSVITESTTRLSTDTNQCRRAPSKQPTVNGDICRNLEENDKTKIKNVANSPELPKSVPQLKEPTFCCPVCMGPFVEETSTKCGHIFCKNCIKAAIAAQKKCPTCRRKLKVNDTFRIYLPTSN